MARNRPSATMPCAYPLARGHPSGSIFRLTARLFSHARDAACYERALDKGSAPPQSKATPTSLHLRLEPKGAAFMSVTQPPKDTPFGLEPNVAAGLAYLFCLLGGLVMLLGGGTNRFVKWAAAQSITLWVVYFVLWFVLGFLHLWLVYPILWILSLVLWVWTTVTGFQGKEIRIPGISTLAESVFKSQL